MARHPKRHKERAKFLKSQKKQKQKKHEIQIPVMIYTSTLSNFAKTLGQIIYVSIYANVQCGLWAVTLYKFILNFPEDISNTERLCVLELLLLEHRQETTDLMLLYKIRNGLINTDLKLHLFPLYPTTKQATLIRTTTYNWHITSKPPTDPCFFHPKNSLHWNSLPLKPSTL